MVLWEITLTTAYFLGLKRTYKLALRLQRSLVGSDRTEMRQFLHRRTRMVFDIAVKIHQNIQQMDSEMGKNLGNWILHLLDHAQPAAQIQTLSAGAADTSHLISPLTSSSQPLAIVRHNARKASENWNRGRLFFSSIRPKSLPSIAMMIQFMRPAGMNSIQNRYASQYTSQALSNNRISRLEGVFRKDIAQLMMLQN